MSDAEGSKIPPQKQNPVSEGERIRELRDRLYSRGDMIPKETRHTLPVEEAPVRTPVAPVVLPAVQYNEVMSSPKRNKWRRRLILLGIFFFVVARMRWI